MPPSHKPPMESRSDGDNPGWTRFDADLDVVFEEHGLALGQRGLPMIRVDVLETLKENAAT
jgi:hypothetical protein